MKTAAFLSLLSTLGLLLAACTTTATSSGRTWKLNRLDAIGGHTPEVLGSPKTVREAGRTALCFDGKADGLFLPLNPIQGFSQFTIQVLMRPDGDGPAEQRFLHIQDGKEQRVLIET